MSFTIIRPKTHDGWLLERQKGIGSSEVATILGINPYDTPLKLWRRKKGLDPAKEMNQAMLMGHFLEDAVAKCWEHETGLDIIGRSAGDWLMVDNDRPFLRVSPDRTYWLPNMVHNHDNKGIVEIKTTQMQVDEDNIPQYWFCQLMYQLGVSGYSEGWLAWLVNGRDFGTKHYDFNPDFYLWMRGELEKFWRDSIIGGKEPEAVSVDDLLIKYPTHKDGKSIEASEAIYNASQRLKTIKAEIEQLTSSADELTSSIKVAIGDAEALMFNGSIIATWKAAKPSMKFDSTSFKADHPDFYDKYIKETPGSRRFVLK